MINLSVWNARSAYRFTTIDLGDADTTEVGADVEQPSFGLSSVVRRVSWNGLGGSTQYSVSNVSMNSSLDGIDVSASSTSTTYQFDSGLTVGLLEPISAQSSTVMSLEINNDGISWSRRDTSLSLGAGSGIAEYDPSFVMEQRTGSISWGDDGVDLSSTFNRVSTSLNEPELSITRIQDDVNVSTGPDMGWSHRRLELNSNGQDVAINQFARSYDGFTTTELVSSQQLGLAIG